MDQDDATPDLGAPGPPGPPHATRPPFALESHEDKIYHERSLPDRATEPEFCAFLNKSWVFNRALRWIDAPGGTLVCCAEGGDLALTGSDRVLEWFSDPANQIEPRDTGHTCFFRRSNRRCDCAVLPGFQFNVDQHPRLRIKVTDTTTDWQLAVLIKGRAGPPLLATPWQAEPDELTLDLRAALRRRGFDLHFAELTFAVGLWNADTRGEDAVLFSLELCAESAVVPCLPVVRTDLAVRSEGLPVSAVLLDAAGRRVAGSDATLTAQLDKTFCDLKEHDGLWSGWLRDVPVGDHAVRLVARGAVDAATDLQVRVTDGEFLDYDPHRHVLAEGGKPAGPLSGSYQGLVYARDAGGPNEALVQGQEAFDAWDRSQPPGEHWHYWEALTPSELDARFRLLAANGWNLLHLCQHWGVWEKLDAGGRVAPHGAEQLALYYRTAARHGLRVAQALSHYPYGTGFTPPYRQHLDAGYQNEDWADVGSSFTERFHGYLADYAALFRDETAVAWLTASGEGDVAAGPARVNHTARFLAERAPNHLFLSEPIFRMERLPRDYYTGWHAPRSIDVPDDAPRDARWEQPLFGSRLYWIGGEIEPELDLGIEFKLMRLGPVFVAEGSWPCPHRHAAFVGKPGTWCGTAAYRTRLRDSLYLGLVHRIPILMTWDEQLTEDEHRLFDVIRRQVDWSQPFQDPPVALRVDSANVTDRRDLLRQAEAAFSAAPLATRYLESDLPAPPHTQLVLDLRERFEFSVPDDVLAAAPLCISDGFRANYAWSEDRRTLLAYLCNATHHVEADYTHCLGGRLHRAPRPAPLRLELRNFPTLPATVRVYDLTAKRLVHEQMFSGHLELDLAAAAADYFLLVLPAIL